MLDQLFRATVCWLAPMLPFTAEEAWLARYPSGGRLGAPGTVSRRARRLARRRAGGEMAQGAAGAPRRHRRARDRAGAKAHRLLARGGTHRRTCPTPICSRRCVEIDLAEVVDHLGRDPGAGRGPAGRVPPRRGQGRRGRGAARRRAEMRAVVEDPAERRLRSRPIPTCPRATPRRCASGKRCARRRSDACHDADRMPFACAGSLLWGALTRLRPAGGRGGGGGRSGDPSSGCCSSSTWGHAAS